MGKATFNPVMEYFSFNHETFKSTCMVCGFAMAGKHSENLLRHLKRKHVPTYEAVMHKKLIKSGMLPEDGSSSEYFSKTSNGLNDTNTEEEEASSHQSYEEVFIGKSEIIDIEEPPNHSDQSGTPDISTTNNNAISNVNNLGGGGGGGITVKSFASSASPSTDDTYFMQYLESKFRKYSTRTKNTVQFHIHRVLFKADMGCFDNAEPGANIADEVLKL
ncbi:uncharacterized protein LOC115633367 [Scaptodrosophila lebanonensis]|uniref:Uncharacterized protein LOC115633367 n=1 Tax=Drosophila lebanonensis TaxID=7225 RepID=A0A6J2UDX0_DROLE|nr:uncharacterized protein LOC115633367 [Scaptodrosophila lebanonensis]